MFDEICRRCNGKHQGRRRGGRSVQLPDSFMILHSFETFMHVYVRTIRMTKYIQRKKKRKKSPLGGQVSGWTCTCVQKFRVYLLDRNGVDIKFWCGQHVYFT